MASKTDLAETKDDQLVNAFKRFAIKTDTLLDLFDNARPGKAFCLNVLLLKEGMEVAGVSRVDLSEPLLQPFIREMKRCNLSDVAYWLIILRHQDGFVPVCLNVWGCLSPRLRRQRVGKNGEIETVEPVDDGVQANELNQDQFLALPKQSQRSWISNRLETAAESQDTSLSLEQYVKRLHAYRVIHAGEKGTGYITQVVSAGPNRVEIGLVFSTVGRDIAECKTESLGSVTGRVADKGTLLARMESSAPEAVIAATLRVAIGNFASDMDLRLSLVSDTKEVPAAAASVAEQSRQEKI